MFVSIQFTFVVVMTEASYRSTIRYSNRTSGGYDSPSFRCCPSSAKLPYKILSYNYQLAIVIVIIIITINNTHIYIYVYHKWSSLIIITIVTPLEANIARWHHVVHLAGHRHAAKPCKFWRSLATSWRNSLPKTSTELANRWAPWIIWIEKATKNRRV